jgi:hypothetical protein
MPLPIPANTTCDIYRTGNAPPAAPNVPGVPCYLRPDWRAGQAEGTRTGLPAGLTWTHVLLVDVAIDIRDRYVGTLADMVQDSVWIPDKNGTQFVVTFVERVGRGTSLDHKRVYVDRAAPAWPTNDI